MNNKPFGILYTYIFFAANTLKKKSQKALNKHNSNKNALMRNHAIFFFIYTAPHVSTVCTKKKKIRRKC